MLLSSHRTTVVIYLIHLSDVKMRMLVLNLFCWNLFYFGSVNNDGPLKTPSVLINFPACLRIYWYDVRVFQHNFVENQRLFSFSLLWNLKSINGGIYIFMYNPTPKSWVTWFSSSFVNLIISEDVLVKYNDLCMEDFSLKESCHPTEVTIAQEIWILIFWNLKLFWIFGSFYKFI